MLLPLKQTMLRFSLCVMVKEDTVQKLGKLDILVGETSTDKYYGAQKCAASLQSNKLKQSVTPLRRAEGLLSTRVLKEMSTVAENIQRGTFQDGFCSLTKAEFSVLGYVLIPYDGFRSEGHCDWNR